MAPFSSGFYAMQMAARPEHSFAPNIWQNAATPRCRHFLWLLQHDRLPTATLLQHRNIIDSALCTYCGAHEDQHHILLQCPRARRVWRLAKWDCAPYLHSPRELWQLPQLQHYDPRVASAIVTVLLWNIWKRRNVLHFDDRMITPERVIHATADDSKMWSH